MKPQETKKPRFNYVWLFFIVWAIVIFRNFMTAQAQFTELTYSDFLKQLKSGNVNEVIIQGDTIRGKLKSPVNSKSEFVAVKMDPEFSQELAKYNVKFSQATDHNFLREMLSWVLPTVIFFSLWIFLAKKMQSGVSGSFMSMGKNRSKVYVETDTKTTFKDVAGVDEAKEELREVVGFLKSPDSFHRLGARTPRGILLVGPPGTGKTMLAKAVAGEAGVPFFSINGSEFVEMFVGLGAARVRDLFEQARTKSPCIIFIDELDALGKSRNSPFAGGHDEKEQTLNQLLGEMDGFDSSTGIVLLAATNRPEILDPALLRAGRFDRQILVDRPDKRGRAEILKVHSKKIKLATHVDLDKVADLTPGFTGADIANLVNEAAIVATRRKAEDVTLADFTVAMERIVAGLEKKSRILNPKERTIVAHHEMGHAFVAAAVPGSDPVHKISVIPRGIGALGYTLQRPIEDRYLMTEQELRNKIKVLLGGRAAEKLIFNHLSTGASDDLQKATNIARDMILRYGMSPHLGSVAYDSSQPTFLGQDEFLASKPKFSEQTAQVIDKTVRNIIEECLIDALHILSVNRNLLELSAQLLLEKETLDEDDLKKIFSKLKPVELKTTELSWTIPAVSPNEQSNQQPSH